MTAAGTAPAGEFVRNLMIFVRLLREAGLRVGPERALLATEALAIVGLDHREDVRSGLAGVLVDAPEHRPVFDALFEAIFQPGLLEQALLGRAGEAVPGAASRAAPHMPAAGNQDDGSSAMRFAANQRVARALASLRAERSAAAAAAPTQARERAGGYTRDEQLRSSDFRSMTVEEFSEAALRATCPRSAHAGIGLHTVARPICVQACVAQRVRHSPSNGWAASLDGGHNRWCCCLMYLARCSAMRASCCIGRTR
jgi:uncharacterized protein with von Willebrand factor type A (vWA) domain